MITTPLDNRNNHPFPGKVGNTHFALAHNGVLHNDLTLRVQMKLPNTPIKTDSYIAVQLLEQQKTLDMKSIGEMAELVEGSFVFTVLDDCNNLYFVKGDNPLALYHYEKYGFYVYASTESILDRSLTRLGILGFEHTEIDTNCGDIIKIDRTGAMERGLFDTSNLYAFLFLAMFIKTIVEHDLVINPIAFVFGFIFGFLLLAVHELLHAVVYPKDAKVTVGKLKGKLVFVSLASFPMSRFRFILMSLIPFVLGQYRTKLVD